MNETTLILGDRNPIEVATVSDVGNVRESNQDSHCSLLAPNTARGVEGIFAVADGMGGHAAGEVASQLAIKLTVKHLSRQGVDFMRLARQAQSIPDVLKQVVESINREVYRMARQPGLHGMGTTLTLAALSPGHISIANVGDSRAYLKRAGSLEQLTVDDTWIQEEVDSGAISAESARNHPRRNILTQAIGLENSVSVRIFQSEIQNGDLLLFCSDGLTESLEDDEIEKLLTGDIEKSAGELMKSALRSSGKDNITILVARVVNSQFNTTQAPPMFTDETISLSDLNNGNEKFSMAAIMRGLRSMRDKLPVWRRGAK